MNGTFVRQHIMNAAIAVAKTTHSRLHAYFVRHDSSHPQFDYLFPNDLSLTQNILTGKSIAEEDKELVNMHTRLFVDACTEAGVPYMLEQENQVSLRQLVAYSAFADFIMADARANIDQYRLGDLLADAHCPVLLFPAEPAPVKRVLFAYDGSFSSIYAIKMFRYLFPEWREVDARLVYAADRGQDLPFREEIMGWIGQHYPNIHIEILKGAIQEQLTAYMGKESQDAVVVMGAYGRSIISRMIHRSLADEVIEKARCAIFVVHERN